MNFNYIEQLVEDIKSSVNEIRGTNKLNIIKSELNNIEDYVDNLYCRAEEENANNDIDYEQRYKNLVDFIKDKLTYQDKIDLRINYNIDVEE